MLDPYQFLNDFISDTVPPQIHSIMAIPQGGTFNGSTSPVTLSPSPVLTAWGKVGFAIWADDYMQGSYNHYGIHETLLYVDGQMVFHSVVDNIPVSMNRMVNSWGYYDHWRHTHRWFMKSYREPGNTLPFLVADANRGVIDFSQQRDYHLEYVLRDFKGNEVRHPFTVRGTEAPRSAAVTPTFTRGLRWRRTVSISRPGVQLVVPYGLLAADATLAPIISRQPDSWSAVCQFSQSSLPLMRDALLSLYALPAFPVYDPSKLYIADEHGRYMGGDYHDGWVTSRVRELGGRYQVAYDDQPPMINPLSLTGDILRLNVTDGQSGIAHWTATVDGRFVVFDAVEKSSTYACELRESWLRRNGGSHRLHFEVTDLRQNTRVFDTTFNY